MNKEQLKEKYKEYLDCIPDIGASNLTLGEQIDKLSREVNEFGLVEYDNALVPVEEYIDLLAYFAKKNLNFIKADKITVKETGISVFRITEIAKSLNPKFTLDNIYVRYFLESYEKLLEDCHDLSELDKLIKEIISSINPYCSEVIKEVNILNNKYFNKIVEKGEKND